MKESVLRTKSYAFALRIIKLNEYVLSRSKSWVIPNQVLRSGTSVGANIFEASQAESSKDFKHKLSISNKEAKETEYWLMLLRDSGRLTDAQAKSIISDCKELQKILTRSILTLKARQKSERNASQKKIESH